ncbi:hypothetical protein AYX13_02304 [Cryptococcus neoformans]|nr:hypothetical protein AYX13_02304 [Cryptococcus neoformans var. grubii]
MSARSPRSPKMPLTQAPVPLSPVALAPKRGKLPSFTSSPASPTTITHRPSSDNNAPIRLQMFSSSIDNWLTAKLPPGLIYFISQNVGLVLVAISELFFVLMGLTVKYFLSATQISTTTLIFVRMGITAICCVLSLWLINRDPNPFLGPPGIRRILILRGFFGFMGLLSSYQSLRGLTLSDSVTIQFLAPSVTALLGFLFLHETLSQREILAGFFCLVGVVLVSRPPFIFGGEGKGEDIALPEDGGRGTRLDLPLPPGEGDQQGNNATERAIAVTWAFVAVFFASMAYTTIRWIGNKAHALHSITYFSYSCTITCGLWLLFKPGHIVWVSSLRELLFILTIGLFGFAAQTFLTLGLQREKAGRAGLAIYLQVVFSLLLEFVLWGTIPSFLSALGTVLILASAIWAAISSTPNRPQAKPTDPEAVPFSRTPSPIPPPVAGYGRRSRHSSFRAGKHYNYDSIPTSDAENEGEGDTKKRERGPSRKGSILSSNKDSVLGLSIGGDTNLDKPPSRLGPSLGDRRESQLSATSATSNGGVDESRNGVIGGNRRNSRFRAKSDTE